MHVYVHTTDQIIIPQPGSPEACDFALTLSLPFAVADRFFFFNGFQLFIPSFVTTLGQSIKKPEYILSFWFYVYSDLFSLEEKTHNQDKDRSDKRIITDVAQQTAN